jgi:hypothetical protein
MDSRAVPQSWYNSELIRHDSLQFLRRQITAIKQGQDHFSPQLVEQIIDTSHQKKMLKPEIVHKQSIKQGQDHFCTYLLTSVQFFCITNLKLLRIKLAIS